VWGAGWAALIIIDYGYPTNTMQSLQVWETTGQGSGLAIQMYRRLLADPVLHNDDNNDLADPFD